MEGNCGAERELVKGTFLFRDGPDEAVELALADPRAVRQAAPKGAVIYTPNRFQRSLGVVLYCSVAIFTDVATPFAPRVNP